MNKDIAKPKERAEELEKEYDELLEFKLKSIELVKKHYKLPIEHTISTENFLFVLKSLLTHANEDVNTFGNEACEH